MKIIVPGLLVFFSLISGCASAPEKPDYLYSLENTPVTIQWLRTGDIGRLPLVKVKIEGHPQQWILDTGASSHVISAHAAQKLNLKETKLIKVNTASGQQTVPLHSLQDYQLGPVKFATLSAIEINLSEYLYSTGIEVAGIVGTPAIQASTTFFNFSENQVSIHPASVIKTRKAYFSLPIKVTHGVPLVEIHINKKIVPLILDTGNSGALVLFSEIAKRLQLVRSDTDFQIIEAKEAGEKVRAELALAERVSLGNQTFEKVPVALIHDNITGFSGIAGSIGMALLDKIDFTLDIPQKVLLINQPSENHIIPGGFGFLLQSGTAIVKQVLKNSPAEKNGILAGDHLMHINHAGNFTTAGQVWQELTDKESAKFVFFRQRKKIEIELQRDWFLPSIISHPKKTHTSHY